MLLLIPTKSDKSQTIHLRRLRSSVPYYLCVALRKTSDPPPVFVTRDWRTGTRKVRDICFRACARAATLLHSCLHFVVYSAAPLHDRWVRVRAPLYVIILEEIMHEDWRKTVIKVVCKIKGHTKIYLGIILLSGFPSWLISFGNRLDLERVTSLLASSLSRRYIIAGGFLDYTIQHIHL